MKKITDLTGYKKFPGLNKLFRIMKLTCLLIFISVVSVFASRSYSQTKNLNLNLENVTVKDVLSSIEDQSEFYFMFSSKVVDVDREVSANFDNRKIDEVLNSLFEGTNVDYTIKDRIIVLTTPEVFKSESKAEFQQKSVSGKITDSSGNSMPGVTVIVKGTTKGTVTDINGSYIISNLSDTDVLQFSFIGMKSQEITVSGEDVINVVLEEESIGIDEVIAIGYGTIKKSDLTGSVASVKVEDLKGTNITSIDKMLQGKASGIVVTETSGQPGAGVSVRIRGNSSISMQNEPLYVIDGFPVYPDDGAYSFSGDKGGTALTSLSMLNPGDIESIEILKDASATAIYGSRGANGVILVTTKRGTQGAPKVEYSVNYGLENVVNTYDVLDAKSYVEYKNMFAQNSGTPPPYDGSSTNRPLPSTINYPGTDWQNEVLRQGSNLNHNLKFSGGTKQIRYSIGGDYRNQTGVLINSGLKRFTLLSNVDIDFSDKLKLGTSFKFARNITDVVLSTGTGNADTGGFTFAMGANPLIKPYDENGNLITVDPISLFTNPLGELLGKKQMVTQNRLLANFYISYEILPNLILKSSLGTDIINANNDIYYSRLSTYGKAANGYAQKDNKYINSWINENTAAYSLKINENNSINLLGGFTIQKERGDSFSAASRDFVSDLLEYGNLGGGATSLTPYSSFSEWSLVSYLGRINYNFGDKYLLTVNGRADGSSKFGENNKWAFFPSAAVAWRVSNESFMKGIESVSNLKLRLSYGITGNSQIPSYASYAKLGTRNYLFGNVLSIGLGPTSLNNFDLKWETTSKLDIGLDFGLFNNRITFTADYYHNKTDDLLVSVPVPNLSGFGSVLSNVGSIENKGFEFMLSGVVMDKELDWDMSVNFSHNENNVLELEGGRAFQGGNAGPTDASPGRVEVGYPVGYYWGYLYDGVFKTQAELDAGPKETSGSDLGYARYKDVNGDNKISAEDRTWMGDPNPDFTMGFSNTFRYKNFDLNILFNIVYGQDVYNGQKIMSMYSRVRQSNIQRAVYENSWSVNNPNNNWPMLADKTTIQPNSSFFVEDGSFIRLQNLSVGYNFKINKLFDSARIFVNGQNLFLITNYTGLDPEVNNFGQNPINRNFDLDAYPKPRVVSIGFNASF